MKLLFVSILTTLTVMVPVIAFTSVVSTASFPTMGFILCLTFVLVLLFSRNKILHRENNTLKKGFLRLLITLVVAAIFIFLGHIFSVQYAVPGELSIPLEFILTSFFAICIIGMVLLFDFLPIIYGKIFDVVFKKPY